jgi:hypothetical protein
MIANLTTRVEDPALIWRGKRQNAICARDPSRRTRIGSSAFSCEISQHAAPKYHARHRASLHAAESFDLLRAEQIKLHFLHG